jgi:NAD(P)-dependent dehydrogenase (short-subunit alcohol dehydrogenase family)
VEHDFTDANVLVTGGASGIGAATAEAFAQSGARVVLADINGDGGEEVAARLRASGAEARFIRADATCEADVERMVQTTVDTFGGIDVAANVVGGATANASGPDLHTLAQEDWDDTLALSLRSTFLCLKHELAYMIEHGGGSIVNVASLTGLLYVPSGGAAYSAAKAGVIHLSRFAALSYADRGVRVNSISPGATVTPIYEQADEGLIDLLMEGHAIKRLIQPGEQAAAILWLCSKAAGMVTGQDLRVDGGWSAR